MPEANADPSSSALAQETEAARTSRLFATTNTTARSGTASAVSRPIPAVQTGKRFDLTQSPIDPDSLQNMQDRKLAFLNASVDRKTVSPDRLANPASRYVVQAGAVIPGGAHHRHSLRSAWPGDRPGDRERL